MLFKSIVLFFLSSSFILEDAWVSVPRSQRIPHQLEEDDRSIWVVFSKKFGEEKILVRFPEDPIYRRKDGSFIASASHGNQGEFSLIVRKKTETREAKGVLEYAYADPENPGRWVRERHVESSDYHYVLRLSHLSSHPVFFSQFADSFEIEKKR